jgi:hypothetical protein
MKNNLMSNKTENDSFFKQKSATEIGLIGLFMLFTILALARDLGFLDFNLIPIDIDWGGVSSLFMLILIIVFFRLDQEILNKLKPDYHDNFWNIIIIFFVLAGFISLWYALRTFGLFVKNSLIIQPATFDPFVYTTSQIFVILGFILTTNLCFTLARTFKKIGAKPKEKKDIEPLKKDSVPYLSEAIIQAVIIGLITFVPRYSDEFLLDSIGGNNRVLGATMYVIILIALIATLLFLVYFRKKGLFKLEESSETN